MNPIRKTTCLSITVVVILALTLVACGGAKTTPTPTAIPKTTLLISGAGGTTLALQYLSKPYTQQRSDLAFEFLTGLSSGSGVKGVLAGQLTLAAMSRLPTDSEMATGIVYLQFCLDRLAVATSPDLSLTGLTSQQIKDIFLGRITRWSAVGGPDALINVFVREEDEANTLVLRKALFGDAAFVPGSVVLTSEGDTRTALSRATNAIGYLAYSGVRLDNLPLHILTVDGQDPSKVDSAYPYNRSLGVAYLPSNAATLEPFLDFIVSPQAQALLAQQGMVPLSRSAKP